MLDGCVLHHPTLSSTPSLQYWLGKVLGCGSFGVVQECLESSTGHRYAVKKISKIPKKGASTPRYLLKLRAEVEIMKQLGYSLNAVNLKACVLFLLGGLGWARVRVARM